MQVWHEFTSFQDHFPHVQIYIGFSHAPLHQIVIIEAITKEAFISSSITIHKIFRFAESHDSFVQSSGALVTVLGGLGRKGLAICDAFKSKVKSSAICRIVVFEIFEQYEYLLFSIMTNPHDFMVSC